jgi:hypothetical protein
VFAVVQRHQRGSLCDVVGEHVEPPGQIGALQTQCLGDGDDQEIGTTDLGQRHHPAPVTEAARLPSAVRTATRDFPTPPGPTRVTTREEARRSRTVANSALRPTKEV